MKSLNPCSEIVVIFVLILNCIFLVGGRSDHPWSNWALSYEFSEAASGVAEEGKALHIFMYFYFIFSEAASGMAEEGKSLNSSV